MSTEPKNYAFIDGQNLHMGTSKDKLSPWDVDLSRFRVYLLYKYKVSKAYYFIGAYTEANINLYQQIEKAGYVLIFRQYSLSMSGKKKGNVDSDIIFHIMKKLYLKEDFSRVVLVSGDGDYKLLVDFLIEENRFEKILFPNKKRSSSLYKKLGNKYSISLDSSEVKEKIDKKKRVP